MKRYIFSIALTAWITACATSGKPPIPEVDSPAGQLYLNKCTSCHSWVHPKRHSAREWDHYLGLMETHMKKRGTSMTQEEISTIRTYLHNHAR